IGEVGGLVDRLRVVADLRGVVEMKIEAGNQRVQVGFAATCIDQVAQPVQCDDAAGILVVRMRVYDVFVAHEVGGAAMRLSRPTSRDIARSPAARSRPRNSPDFRGSPISATSLA